MTKARTLADFISDGSPLADGTVDVSEVSGAAPLASPTFTGTVTGTFSGDVSGELDLNAIAESKGVTAVDVFVYDTSKDSDGGAWRKRIQGTSWYNETLNTATRGSRKEFPAVAVIVAEAGDVTIYDGDDPALPMWMVFNAGAYSMCPNGSVSSIFALNGIICMAGNLAVGSYANSGIRQIMFLKDTARKHTKSNGHSGLYKGNIEQRNDSLFDQVGFEQNIVDELVNDVAMTVLPNAPIDPATGLPVPTIAVATDGGVSVIKDDGTVVDIISSNAPNGFASVVDFGKDNSLWYALGTASKSVWVYSFDSLPVSDNVVTYNSKTGTVLDATSFYATGPVASDIDLLVGYADSTQDVKGLTEKSVGTALGLSLIKDDTTAPAKGMVAYTTSTYNTGWMNGDIKGAFLSDTDDTDLVGATIYTSDFTSTVDGFTGNNATLTLDADRLKVEDAGSNGVAYQNFSVTAGKPYVLKVRYNYPSSNTNSDYALQVRATSFTGTVLTQKTTGFVEDTPTEATLYFTPTVNTVSVLLAPSSATGDVGFFDNVSVKLADADRSVNANGLVINGTVTRNPVATGADLVAYSGFSASNYLEQPYNSDLDFGTGDFCIMGWMNTDAPDGYILERGDVTRSGPYFYLYHNADVVQMGGHGGGFDTGDVGIASGTWRHFCIVRSSGIRSWYVDGDLKTSAANTTDYTNTNAVLRLAHRITDGASPQKGSLALLRISATAPSPEQIAKIYEDEKVLFQENAQATLYGSSDAVTALAHDDATNLLHVGTSAGRSVFQGLRRVENTTTAVGTAISANNGLVVEE